MSTDRPTAPPSPSVHESPARPVDPLDPHGAARDRPARPVDPLDPHGPLRRSFLNVVADRAQVLAVALSREQVRALELGPALAPVHVAHEEEVVGRAEATLRYVFGGYERDPRPVHEIGEVRRFARALDEEAPALLFFLDRAQRGAFALCVVEADPAGVAAWRVQKREAVLGLGRAYGFDAGRAWTDVEADLEEALVAPDAEEAPGNATGNATEDATGNAAEDVTGNATEDATGKATEDGG